MTDVAFYEGLFIEAQRESVAAAARGVAAEEGRRRAWAARVIAAQARLSAEVKERLPGAVRAAAAGGERVAKLLEFAGTDAFRSSSPEDGSSADDEDFCYLFLLKGPHVANRAQRDDFQASGGVPLLPYLRRELHPFRVRHVWDRSTNNNLLLAEW